MKRFFTVAIASLLLIFTIMPVFVNASTSDNEHLEVVILLDVSNSMNSCDPAINGTRVTTEGAKTFAFLRPSFAETYVSLIIYNDNISTVLERTNIRTERGLNEFASAIDNVNTNNNGNGFVSNKGDDFNAWRGFTDIGGALDEARNILENSTASQKAVLLFTDGKIELTEPYLVEASKELSNEVRDDFAGREMSIPIYTIGLNANPNDEIESSIDETYLRDLSNRTGGNFEPVESTSELIEIFLFMYADLVESIRPTIIDGVVPENSILEYNVSICDQTFKEVNVTFISEFANANIEVIEVVTQTGVDVRKDSKRCIVDASSMVSNVKLIEPMEGEWTIRISAPPDTVIKIGEIFIYNISLRTTLSSDNINVGETLRFSASLYNNDRGIDITNTRIYEDETTRSLVEITDPTGAKTLLIGVLSESRASFDFEVDFEKKGNYTIQCFLENDRLSAESTVLQLQAVTPCNCNFIHCSDCNGTQQRVMYQFSLRPNSNTFISNANIILCIS